MSKTGSTIAERYRLDRRIGAGGMSTVFLAFDTVLERNVAVKLLAEHLAEDEDFVERFKREALSVASLTHANIVQVYDSGVDNAHHFIVMEYIEGQSAAQLLREKKSLPIEQAVDIACQACAGLSYAHSKDIIHRDIKPGNLLIALDGTVKLADFGIAKAAKQTRITQAGSVLGTAAYISPEQAHGREATFASDIYSLGVVVYQLLAGRLPYEYSSLTELALKQQTESIPPLPSLKGQIPNELDRAVAHALARDPSGRFGDASEMAEALRKGAAGIAVALPQAEETEMTRRIAADEYGDEQATAATRAIPYEGGGAATRRAPAPARAKKGSRAGKVLATFLLLLFIGAGVATAVIVTSGSEQSRKFKQVVEDTVEDQIEGLKQLIEENTR